MAKNKKPQNQNKSNEPPKEEVQQDQEPEVQQEQKQKTEFSMNVAEIIDKAIEDRLAGLDELVSKLVGQNINYDEITTSVLQHVEANKPEGGEAPKWYRIDPEKCYQQCFDRALHIVTNGQTQVFMGQNQNCKMLMKQVINLANTMFEALAEEFQIAS